VEDAALFCHILGVLLFVSGAVVAAVAFESARRREAPAEIELLLRQARLGAALVGVGMLLILVFGLWLVDLGDWGYDAGWVEAAILLFVAAAVLGGLGGKAPREARLLAGDLAAEGKPMSAELRALLDDRKAQLLNYVSSALVVAILVLMVWKPGAGES
jgi:uncharacterized membrane protein